MSPHRPTNTKEIPKQIVRPSVANSLQSQVPSQAVSKWPETTIQIQRKRRDSPDPRRRTYGTDYTDQKSKTYRPSSGISAGSGSRKNASQSSNRSDGKLSSAQSAQTIQDQRPSSLPSLPRRDHEGENSLVKADSAAIVMSPAIITEYTEILFDQLQKERCAAMRTEKEEAKKGQAEINGTDIFILPISFETHIDWVSPHDMFLLLFSLHWKFWIDLNLSNDVPDLSETASLKSLFALRTAVIVGRLPYHGVCSYYLYQLWTLFGGFSIFCTQKTELNLSKSMICDIMMQLMMCYWLISCTDTWIGVSTRD